jgi:hypothetical protein
MRHKALRFTLALTTMLAATPLLAANSRRSGCSQYCPDWAICCSEVGTQVCCNLNTQGYCCVVVGQDCGWAAC